METPRRVAPHRQDARTPGHIESISPRLPGAPRSRVVASAAVCGASRLKRSPNLSFSRLTKSPNKTACFATFHPTTLLFLHSPLASSFAELALDPGVRPPPNLRWPQYATTRARTRARTARRKLHTTSSRDAAAVKLPCVVRRPRQGRIPTTRRSLLKTALVALALQKNITQLEKKLDSI